MPTQALTAPEPRRSWLALLGWIALAQAAGVIGSIATFEARRFYDQLAQPAWAPPGGIIGPIWLVLYTLMGIAAWSVWSERGRQPTRRALTLFVVQLAVNAVWSWIFFAWHAGGIAFGWIVLLGALVLATLVAFWKIRPLAGALLLPYLGWLCFAGALNYTIWRANPMLLG
jgi:tryptophan-rich sensory protein